MNERQDLMPKISVIVPAYNEQDYIEAALISLRNQTYPNYEIVVVSNGSTDRTLEIARAFTSHVYELRQKGVARARNFGAKKATGLILVFLDADTTTPPDLLEKVYSAIKEGYVGGKTKVLPAEEGFYWDLFRVADNLLDEWLFYKFGIPNIFSYTPFVFCKKEYFEEVGGFPEGLVATEEIQLLKRLRKRGRIKFIKSSYVTPSSRRAEKQGKLYGGFLLPVFHFFFPKSKKWPYLDVR